MFDELQLRPVARRAPGAGEVEIRVVAAGLNFRDVMNAVAMRDDPEPLGGECAGRVVAVGDGVSGLRRRRRRGGDRRGELRDLRDDRRRHWSRRIPARLSFAEAATLPFAFMTADYALTRWRR